MNLVRWTIFEYIDLKAIVSALVLTSYSFHNTEIAKYQKSLKSKAKFQYSVTNLIWDGLFCAKYEWLSTFEMITSNNPCLQLI